MHASPLAAITFTALIGLTLAGCDAAEQQAQKLTEKAGQAAQELARETISDTVNTLNEKIDQAQKSTSELLGKPVEEGADAPPKDKAEAPAAVPGEGIET